MSLIVRHAGTFQSGRSERRREGSFHRSLRETLGEFAAERFPIGPGEFAPRTRSSRLQKEGFKVPPAFVASDPPGLLRFVSRDPIGLAGGLLHAFDLFGNVLTPPFHAGFKVFSPINFRIESATTAPVGPLDGEPTRVQINVAPFECYDFPKPESRFPAQQHNEILSFAKTGAALLSFAKTRSRTDMAVAQVVDLGCHGQAFHGKPVNEDSGQRL